MIPRNLERRETIHELWLQGFTVDEISSQTGIPRSSVGYYVAKFNQSKNGVNSGSKPPVKPKRFSNTDLIMRRLGWIDFTTQWLKLMADRKFVDAKNMVESVLLLNRLERETMFHVEGEEKIGFEEIFTVAKFYNSLKSTVKNEKEITVKEFTDLLKIISGQQKNSQSPK
jgi:hypothetical protein